MTTNELKSYVDRILGNNVRVLLPSYWWKRAFGAVIDKVDEADSKAASASLSAYRASQKADKASSDIQDKQDTLVSGKNIKTINGSSILGAGNITFNTSGYIVRSEKELNELNVSEGTVASIANKCVKIDNLKKPQGDSDFSDLSPVNGVVITAPTVKDVSITVLLVSNGVHQIALYYKNGVVTYTLYASATTTTGTLCGSNYGVDTSVVNNLNNHLAQREYRYRGYAVTSGDCTDKEALSIINSWLSVVDGATDAYIKADSWERLSKEYIVAAESQLSALDVPNGTIAKVAGGSGKINIADCYYTIDLNTVADDWDKFTIIKTIDEKENVPPESSRFILLKEPEGVGSNYIVFGALNGEHAYAKCENGTSAYISNSDLNSILKEEDYRFVYSNSEDVDSYFNFYTNILSTADVYIKGDTWTRLLKEGDVTGGGLRDLYIYENYDGTFTELTEEQKAWNLETLELAKQGKAIVRTTLHGMTFILELFNEDSVYQFGYTQFSPSGGVAISVYVAEDGLSGIKVEESHFDSELSATSINAVQNKVVKAYIDQKIGDINSILDSINEEVI